MGRWNTGTRIPPCPYHINALSTRSRVHIPSCPPFVFVVDCFCGEGPPEGVDKRERCTTKCEDSDYSCGGEDHLVLYDIPLPGTSPVPVPAPVPSPVSNLQLVVDGTSDLMGCYPYSDNYVILTDGPFTRYGKMTNEVGINWHI